MPIRVVKVFVAICPVCKKRISCTGECDWDVWPTREDLHEALEESTDPAKTWDLRIARSCGRKCEDLYLEAHGHRTFKSTPNEGRPSDHAFAKLLVADLTGKFRKESKDHSDPTVPSAVER